MRNPVLKFPRIVRVSRTSRQRRKPYIGRRRSPYYRIVRVSRTSRQRRNPYIGRRRSPYNRIVRVSRTSRQRRKHYKGDRRILLITGSCAFRARSVKVKTKMIKGEISGHHFSAHTWTYELKIGPINTVCDSALIGDVFECLFVHFSCF